jgi:D-glycero-D-manno-heptose 1,7-bisphosphate phosphatase
MINIEKSFKSMNKAVFLDRDGVLNRNDDTYYVYQPEDCHINKGVIETLLKLQEQGYLLIIISNQGGISKGLYTKKDTDQCHKILLDQCKKHNIRIEEIYYCPHSPSKEQCLCHKPDSLMLEKAIARFRIDKQSSYFIGDSDRDIEAGKKAGVTPIKVESNQELRGVLGYIK